MKAQYAIVTDKQAGAVMREVNGLMADGWEPLGGVVATGSHYRSDREYAQSMVKRIDYTVRPCRD